MRACRWIEFSGVAALLLAGCGGPRSGGSPAAPAPRLPGVLVDVAWLKEQAARPDVVLIDARDPSEYAGGHLPGAVNVPAADLLDPDPANADNMAPVRFIERRLGEAGIAMANTVVVYDGSNYRDAARVFWVLEVHGHPAVSVLNGGVGAWQREGLALSTDAVTPAAARFVAAMQPDRLATKLTVMRALDEAGVAILDARSSDEYEGLVSKAARKGHIAGAVHVDFERNLAVDDVVCEFRYGEELRELYRGELGDRTRVICYCNSGNRASVSYLALRAIGYSAAVYDGSWLEWGNDFELPIEGPAAEAP